MGNGVGCYYSRSGYTARGVQACSRQLASAVRRRSARPRGGAA
eukprot:COSAG01_NODE_11257_length_1971_cov_2.328526_5_plen_42_part_01